MSRHLISVDHIFNNFTSICLDAPHSLPYGGTRGRLAELKCLKGNSQENFFVVKLFRKLS